MLKTVNPIDTAQHLLDTYSLDKINFHDYLFPHYDFNTINISGNPKAGSFVEYSIDDHTIPGSKPHIGIVLNDQHYYLTSSQVFHILTPQTTIEKITPNLINFKIVNFVSPEFIPSLEGSSSEQLAKLSYILNVFTNFSFGMANELIRRDLPRKAYFQLAQTQKQGSATLSDLVSLFADSKAVKEILDFRSNPLAAPALLHITHSFVVNDPIHFRFLAPQTSLMDDIHSYLHPLSYQTTQNFLNPINLACSLLSIYQTDSRILLNKYGAVLGANERYRCFVLLSEDLTFQSLIQFIKYAIEYPHIKILAKLDTLYLPLESAIGSKSLYEFLVNLGVYNKTTNPVFSSEIYGQIKQSKLSGMVGQSLGELKPFCGLRQLILHDKDENRDLEIPSVVESIPAETVDVSPIYQITKGLAFSLRKISITQYRFNFFLPIPRQKLTKWMIANPISFSKLFAESLVQIPDQLPTYVTFKNRESQPRTCFRISFVFDYLESDSLSNPDVEVALDQFKHTQTLEEYLFDSRLSNTDNSKSGQKVFSKMLAVDKLRNLLKQKEQARLQEGLLMPEKDDPVSADSRAMFIDDTKALLDEYLSLYCQKQGISVIHRVMEVDRTESTDSRKSRRFKIFKWYANSYETFRQSGKMDMTNFIGSLKYVKPMKLQVGSKPVAGFKPLGLKSYASFNDWDYVESYVNNLQLLNHLSGKTLLSLKELIPKIGSNSNAFLQLKRRLKRYQTLKQLEDSEHTITALRCIVVDPPTAVIINDKAIYRNAKAYCMEFDLMVDVEVGEQELSYDIMVGDRLICSEILELDPVAGKIVIK
ncbi:hypothetical protein FOA43_001535 [Brettanomyces nanus]|uniref:Uncharacterized protein n=1 Tax=Eeniella nana TaxID=13502 RepID=A0A875RXL1_EENNA|nr:uncharacterized protein FOA43_001535 [Brettanomyces nanus]QPG74211.1 hypothetical protein FOA43_001535 [Brettanomyces nanus]